MSYEESVAYLKCLENLRKIRRTNVPNPSSLQVDDMKSIASSVGKSSKHHKGSNMSCHYCNKNNNNTADCRIIVKFEQQKKACFESKSGPRKEVFVLTFRKNQCTQKASAVET
jgi:hypothetical protein